MTLEYLKPYMITNHNLNYFFNNDNKKIISKTTKKSENKSPNIFIPYQNDKLFWIFYYIQNGYIEYNLIGSNSFTKEMDMKLNLSTIIKKNKSIFKEYKFKRIGDNENEIICEKEISFKTFILLCIIHKINIMYIVDNMYYKIIFEDNDELYLIHNLNNNYGCEKIPLFNLPLYEKNRYHIEFYDKPLLCMTHYKMEDLTELANILKLDLCDENNKKLKKNDLYDNINNKFNIFYKID